MLTWDGQGISYPSGKEKMYKLGAISEDKEGVYGLVIPKGGKIRFDGGSIIDYFLLIIVFATDFTDSTDLYFFNQCSPVLICVADY